MWETSFSRCCRAVGLPAKGRVPTCDLFDETSSGAESIWKD